MKKAPPHENRASAPSKLAVSSDGNDSIVSERDLASGLATYGSRLLTIPISELMTKAVVVCSPQDSVTEVIELMTMRRIRHVPVKDGDQLVGIISIGDVLKERLGELQVAAVWPSRRRGGTVRDPVLPPFLRLRDKLWGRSKRRSLVLEVRARAIGNLGRAPRLVHQGPRPDLRLLRDIQQQRLAHSVED